MYQAVYGVSLIREAMRNNFKNIVHQTLLLFAVIRGVFQPGLAKIVGDIVARHLGRNSEFRVNRYPPLVRAMRWVVSNPFPALTMVACLYLGILFALHFGWVDDLDPAADNNQSARDFWTVNVAVFGVQAALIGVVFPLVIAFVGLLNQGRASFASRLTIYIASSGAFFVGPSSLLLCIAIAVQLPFGENLVNVSRAATLLNIAWFSVNTLALGYFVLRTIAFLHPAQRAPITRSYVANVIWPRELVAAVTSNHWHNVIEYEHLPSGDKVDPFADEARARVWYSALREGGKPRVSRRLSGKKRLIDVRFGVLAAVVDSWLTQAHELDDGQVHDFVIPLQPGWTYEGNRVLARATTSLGPIACTAIKASLKFGTAPVENGAISATSKILEEMIADLIALIDSNQANEFGDQLREVIKFHAFLYRLAQNIDEGFNYSQLGSGQSIFNNALSEDWAKAYRDVIHRIIKRLPDEPQFMRSMVYAPSNLYLRVSSEVTPAALSPLLGLAESIAYDMTEWALGEYRAEKDSGLDDGRAFSLTRRGEVYAGAWREQVAGWESLLTAIARGPDRRNRGDRTWQDFTCISENIAKHLRATTKMTARAVWLGDTLATSWTSDLVLHWLPQAERGWNPRSTLPIRRSEALTLEVLQLDWEAVEKLPLKPRGEAVSASGIFSAVMNNVWRDHVFILASVCIHWAIYHGASETAPKAAHMLLHRKPHDRGDTGLQATRDFSGVDFLISALRIVGSGEHFSDKSYAGSFDHLLEGLGRLEEEAKVSMRIYSSSGGLSFSSLPIAQAIALMVTTSSPQGINSDFRHFLTHSVDDILRRREDFLTRLIAAFDEISADEHQELLTSLVRPGDALSFDARRDHARRLVEQSFDELKGYRAAAIVDAPIDNTRMATVTAAAASEAFSKTGFPRQLFDEITATDQTLSEFTMSLSGVSKGEFTDPPMGVPVLNEEDWWRQAMSNQVAVVIWSDIIGKTKFLDIQSQTPDDFWQVVREGSAKLRDAGLDPILVIGNTFNPDWWFDWVWPESQGGTSRPSDLVITTEEGQLDSYECTMNDIPVYRAQTEEGVAYLIPTQLFSKLRFHEFCDGSSVALDLESDPENPWSGTMHATFQREVELANFESYRVRWAQVEGMPLASED